MRIESGSNSLQMLKAQQAWEARRAVKSNTTQPAQETKAPAAPTPASRIQRSSPEVELVEAPQGAAPMSPQWDRTVREVQTIAAKAGFVGVSEQDIRRAYTHGESLLADYRV